jgi:cytochrome c oxidase assembly protein subunit 11
MAALSTQPVSYERAAGQRLLRTAVLAVLGICFMTGLAWASVPLYRIFCQATGVGGAVGRAARAPGAVAGKIQIAFDTNVAPGMKWSFRPESQSETIDIGARDMAFFLATNTSDKPITGTASYNITPYQAAPYFKKIQCFCFTQQTLQPGETARMPVIFFVDPAILKDPDANDVQTITLSYTFYPVDSAKKPG